MKGSIRPAFSVSPWFVAAALSLCAAATGCTTAGSTREWAVARPYRQYVAAPTGFARPDDGGRLTERGKAHPAHERPVTSAGALRGAH